MCTVAIYESLSHAGFCKLLTAYSFIYFQDITVSELSFPNADKVKHASLPKRKIAIPTEFQSHVHYRQVFKAALTGMSNTMLCKMLSFVHHVFLKLHKSRLRGKDIISIVCWKNCLYLNLDLYTSLYAYIYTHMHTHTQIYLAYT